MLEINLVVLIVLFASVLQGFTGFGYGLLLMAALPFYIPITTATTLVSFSATFIGFYMIWRNRNNIDLRTTIYPLVGAIVFVPLGVFLLNFLIEDVLKTILGALLILISIFSLLKGDRQLRLNPSAFNGIMFGAIGGTLNGLLSVGGPPLVLYFIHAAKDKFSYKASLDLIFLITSIYRLIWLYLYGNITGEMGTILIACVPAALVGTILGFYMLIKVDRTMLTRAVYVIMIFAGLSLFFL